MSATYRDDRDAALARAEALRRENARLRAENVWLHGQLDPDGVHPEVARAHRRGAAVGVTLLLGAMSCAVLVARDAGSNIARADADLAFSAEPSRPMFIESAARLAHGVSPSGGVASPEAPPTRAHAEPTVMGAAVAPLLQGCFSGPRSRVDLLAAVDPRGRVRQAHVYVAGRDARSLRFERRCVRRSLASVTLPTTRAIYTSYGAGAELHLVVLPAHQARRDRHARDSLRRR